MTESQMTESLDQYFAIESEELIQTIEQTLVALLEEKTIERVHTLMRAAHTIKGGAANCGLKTIETIAHHLEDVFQALYPEELEIDDELGALLLEGYEVLYIPLSAVLTGYECDEEQVLGQTADLFARLQAKLGDFFGREAPLPTAEDLGFDVVGLIFGDSVPEDLNNIRASLATGNKSQITTLLKTQAEFFLELGASYGLPGISQIAAATLRAIELNPHMIIEIGDAALANFEVARTEILAGDRENGGTVSAALNQCLIATTPSAEFTAELQNTPEPQNNVEIDYGGEPANSSEANDFLGLLDATDFTSAMPDSGEVNEFLDFLGAEDAVPQADQNDHELFGLLHDETTSSNNANDLLDLFDIEATPTDKNDANELIGLFGVEAASANHNDANNLLDLFDIEATPADNNDANELIGLFDVEATSANNNDASELLELIEAEDYESVETIENSGDLSIGVFEPFVESSGSLIEENTPADASKFTVVNNNSSFLATTSPASTSQSALTTSDYSGQLPGQISPIDRILHSISTEIPVSLPPQAPPAAPSINVNAPTIRVAIERLDRLSHAVSELLIDESQQNNRTENIYQIVKEAIEELGRAQNQLGAIRHWSDKNLLHVDKSRSVSRRQEEIITRADSTRVVWTAPTALPESRHNQPSFDMLEMDVYSDLHMLIQKLSDHMDLLGERLENLESSSQKLRASQNKRQRVFAVAQDELLQARMEPISTVFDRFPRLVQQMVTKHKKPAELILAGTSVLVDKSTAEKLYDPLLHLIRNSYDHGLETPEVRASQGKNKSAQIVVSAHHNGNRTTIEVKDNGGGLNFERIRQKGVEQNLISAAQANIASETELAELLFHPGFSTADKVSELSGRGIGLDVVRTQVEALQGSISVKSLAGQGTTFSLQIPLSFTTARLLICKSQGKTYALLSDSVQQIIIPLPKQLQEKSGGQTLYRYLNGSREELIAVQNLADLVSYNCPVTADRAASSPGENAQGLLIMVQAAQGRRCLAIDKIVSEQELVITPIGNVFAMPSFVQGSSTLGDGSLTLAIDPVALLDETGSRSVSLRTRESIATRQNALPAAEDATIEAELLPYNDRNNQITILIVDDSLVQRQGLLRTLSGAGYQVVQAANGQEALAQLNQHPEVQVVVCDIEMPYMNGFEFLSYCRQDARLSQIPTIMLTTRSGAKHRQLALALGAKAYTTKPHSDHELLTAVENMLKTPALV
jgi:two-component system, chemotaxis family, sensor histidine kinase and response regulator PixL